MRLQRLAACVDPDKILKSDGALFELIDDFLSSAKAVSKARPPTSSFCWGSAAMLGDSGGGDCSRGDLLQLTSANFLIPVN